MINYIIKTLQKEKSVLINGLGEFVVQLQHASLERNVIHPPQYEVIFHPTTDIVNNFSLANTISFEKQCLFTEANEEIIKWVDELKKALENNKSVDFEDFGSFSLDRKGDITFSSAKIPQLNPLFEYFEDIDLKNQNNEIDESYEKTPDSVVEKTPIVTPNPISEPQAEVVVTPEPTIEPLPEEPIEPEPVPEPQTEIIPEPEPIVEPISETEPEDELEPEPEILNEIENETKQEEDNEDEEDNNDNDDDDDEDSPKKHHISAWLWILFLLVLVLAAFGFIFRNNITNTFQNWKSKFSNNNILPETENETDDTIDFDATDNEPNDETDISESDVIIEEPYTEATPYTPEVVKYTANNKYPYIRFESGHFYAIAGSFYTEQEVEKHIKQKHLEQYNPSILLQDGVKNLRVCIGVFDSEEEAETFAKNVNKNNWVLK